MVGDAVVVVVDVVVVVSFVDMVIKYRGLKLGNFLTYYLGRDDMLSVREHPFNLKGGGYVFFFRVKIFFSLCGTA